MLGWAANRALLSLDTRKVNACPDSLAGPALMAVAQPATAWLPESSGTTWLAPFVKEGASLTEATEMVKVCPARLSSDLLAVPPESCRRTLRVAMPKALAAGV